MTLISGILNCLLGFFYILGCWTIVFTPLCVALGVVEILYAVKFLPDPVKSRQLSAVVPILQIAGVVVCNPICLVVGILSLVFATDPEVKAYLAR